MQNITVQYRTKPYALDIDTTKHVSHLCEKVSELTGIKVSNFILKLHQIELPLYKPITYFTKDGTSFNMVDVIIDVKVALNGQDLPFHVKANEKIEDFVEEIIISTGHGHEISLHYQERELLKSDTILASGVAQNSILTAINGSPRIVINYKEKAYSFKLRPEETTLQLKEKLSTLTKIKPEHFCLQQDNLYLIDKKTMAAYMNSGTTFKMTNVTLRVFAAVNGNRFPLYINESKTIDDLKKMIIEKTGVIDEMTLLYYNEELVGKQTLLESGIINRTTIIAVIDDTSRSKKKTMTVTYRKDSYNIDINTSMTVLDLKKAVSELTQLKESDFSLGFHWIRYQNSKLISEYLKYGNHASLFDVTITVNVRLDQKNFLFNVKERITVGDFKKVIDKRAGTSVMGLQFNGCQLNETDTLLKNDVKHTETILAVSGVIGG